MMLRPTTGSRLQWRPLEDGTIGRRTDDAPAVIDRQSDGPLILVGSSMGGWIVLLAALARRIGSPPDHIAAAPGSPRR